MRPVLTQICSPGTRLEPGCLDVLIRDGEVLERVRRTGAPKVLRLTHPGGGLPDSPRPAEHERLILKLWYPKKRLSSEILVPYANRFRRRAAQLRENGILAPDPCGWGQVEGSRIRFVCYPEIPGQTLAERIPDVDLEAAGVFLARLHAAGIDFRGIHMGNVLLSPNVGFGLIDVTDCAFPRFFMSRRRRLRRLKSFCAHGQESAFLLANDNWRRFVRSYCESAGLSSGQVIERVARHLERRFGKSSG